MKDLQGSLTPDSSGHIPENTFLTRQMPRLLDRFSLFFEQDETCIEYALCLRQTGKQVSRSLILSHEIFSGSIYVSRFYPELYRELSCKYLSAACFYMLVHHAAEQFHLKDNCRVNLETDTEVFQRFYAKLNDFQFKIQCARPAERVYLRGSYHETRLSRDVIKKISDS